MLSPEKLEEYRRMPLDAKLALTLELIRENTPYLLKGSREVIDRRFALLQRENDLRNRNILQALARSEENR